MPLQSYGILSILQPGTALCRLHEPQLRVGNEGAGRNTYTKGLQKTHPPVASATRNTLRPRHNIDTAFLLPSPVPEATCPPPQLTRRNRSLTWPTDFRHGRLNSRDSLRLLGSSSGTPNQTVRWERTGNNPSDASPTNGAHRRLDRSLGPCAVTLPAQRPLWRSRCLLTPSNRTSGPLASLDVDS